MKISRGPLSISHLLYADDNLTFHKATFEENWNLQAILATYKPTSGQIINKEKHNMTFSRNVPNTLQIEIQNLWGVHTTKQHDRYLGLPALIGKSRKRAFGKIKSHLWKKLLCWKEKLLSQEGNTPQIVALALPNYTTSCFKLSRIFYSELES